MTTLTTRLRALAHQTSTFLLRLHALLSTTHGSSPLLCTLNYTLILLHSRLHHLLQTRYERLALNLATKASLNLLPGETVVATIEPPTTLLSETTASVKAAADLVTDFRFFTRLGGLLEIYASARNNYVKPPGDAILKSLVWGEVGCLALYQGLENAAYLSLKGILLRGERWKQRQGRWDLWANRFWLGHVVLEFLRLMRVRQLRWKEEFGAKESEGDGEGVVGVRSRELERRWRRDFWANVAWFPLAVAWSRERGYDVVSDDWVGICGMVPGVIGLREAWAETAVAVE